MKLSYSILWLDDQIDDFIDDRHIKKINDFLISEGFEPKIITVKNSEDFFNKLDKSYDLILTDYHMEHLNGDVVVNKIRKECNIFTEILFYTAQADLSNIDKLDRISFLQTSRNHHQTVVNKVKNLINLTLNKFHDIVVMRGMIMNETSDFDNEKRELLNSFIKLEKYKDKLPQLTNRVFGEISSFITKKKEFADNCIKNRNFDKLIKDNVLFSADKKISAMSEILKIIGCEDFSADYKKEIINIRNDFAHAKLEEEKDSNGSIVRKYFKKCDITFGQEYCKTIRKNIVKHKKNLEMLKNKIDE